MFKLNINIEGEDVFTYASFTRRVCAYAFDFLTIAMTVLTLGINIHLINPDIVLSRLFLYGIFISMMVFYSSILNISKFKGTLGKVLFKTSVVNYEGESLTFIQSLLRELLKIFTLQLFAPLLACVLFTSRRQALHDLAVKSIVIRKPRVFIRAVRS